MPTLAIEQNVRLGDQLLRDGLVTPEQLHSELASKDFLMIDVHVPYAGTLPQTDTSIPYTETEQLVTDQVNLLIEVYGDEGRQIIADAGVTAHLAINVINDVKAARLLFDLPARKFHLFALTLWPQDFLYLAWLLILAALTLFFVTAVAGILDLRTGDLEYCNAGHEAPHVLPRDGGAVEEGPRGVEGHRRRPCPPRP